MNRIEIVRWSVLAFCAATLGARAEFKVDRSVMSDEYWKVWNDDVQAKVDADIEKYREGFGIKRYLKELA